MTIHDTKNCEEFKPQDIMGWLISDITCIKCLETASENRQYFNSKIYKQRLIELTFKQEFDNMINND